ncbi:MAG: methylenetetrahydrofolate reductase C-terminal domain-containing protein [Deltaproteobacteria bacterium]|nr:methylenetetrahydrofolate reductase C-terminal domain-containing protein [Deltaproteobacteria bacterium]MBW2112495.1 methylenetetrahydrofolate reductase C-terminal domain-containing protein [Deltaproteobacteria bacterium]
MESNFRKDISNPDRFVVTMELVPGEQSRGRSVDTVMRIAEDALRDGRISAVSITDNPGGHPSLSPDVLGSEIVSRGMDVIVHFTCRDQNRVGLESRALQLGHLSIRNILALTGDFAGKGFAGQGAPVFDLDSVSLLSMLRMMNEGTLARGDREDFFAGCAFSPFKRTEEESFCQYFKLFKKVGAGASFAITQVGYDARKFHEALCVQRDWGMQIPTLGSVYLLTPKVAGVMCEGRIPGVVVTKRLLGTVQEEWEDRDRGKAALIDRSARLAVILRGLGYRGVHFGGVHRDFGVLSAVLDRMEEIKHRWREYLPDFDFPQRNGFYLYHRDPDTGLSAGEIIPCRSRASHADRVVFQAYRAIHRTFFNHDAPFASIYSSLCQRLEKRPLASLLVRTVEDVSKKFLFSCQECGDCGIQHLAFFCPESQCPKHTRNGPCGGSRNGMCEVHPERRCVWFRAYRRWASVNQPERIKEEYVPPRRWELNRTSSWINFHLGRDHQGEELFKKPK